MEEEVAVVQEVEAVEVGIEEISEILDALELTLNTAGEVLADGEINFSDVSSALKLINNYKVFIEAVDGASGVLEEGKDLDQVEAMALGLRVYKIVAGLVAVIKAAK